MIRGRREVMDFAGQSVSADLVGWARVFGLGRNSHTAHRDRLMATPRPRPAIPNRRPCTAWVFGQTEVWHDIRGEGHYIDEIDHDYVGNILQFVQRESHKIAPCLPGYHFDSDELAMVLATPLVGALYDELERRAAS